MGPRGVGKWKWNLAPKSELLAPNGEPTNGPAWVAQWEIEYGHKQECVIHQTVTRRMTPLGGAQREFEFSQESE